MSVLGIINPVIKAQMKVLYQEVGEDAVELFVKELLKHSFANCLTFYMARKGLSAYEAKEKVQEVIDLQLSEELLAKIQAFADKDPVKGD